MVSSDSSNSNYASTMIAEGPAVMQFKDWQDHFAYVFKQIYRKVIENAIKQGGLPQKETVTKTT